VVKLYICPAGQVVSYKIFHQTSTLNRLEADITVTICMCIIYMEYWLSINSHKVSVYHS